MRPTFIIGIGLIALLVPLGSAESQTACPPVLKIVSSSPAPNATGISPDIPIDFVWDKDLFQRLTDGKRDLKPALESVNIAGGRYGMGTLLTTEWGIGGSVSWEDHRERIFPEAPLEPGTQYRIWTYLFITIRNDQVEPCPRIGGEVVFITSGVPPKDGRAVRDFDLTTLFHGDDFGQGKLHGTIIALRTGIRVLTLRDETLGIVNLVAYEGTPFMRGEKAISFEDLKPGGRVEVNFSGGRAVEIRLDP